jgi:hypothetical protein
MPLFQINIPTAMILLVLLALLSIVAAVPFSFPCIPGIICGINAPSFGSYVGAKSDKLVVAQFVVIYLFI